MIPELFASILWSHDIAKLDPSKHRTTIVTAAINYGDLEHWRWLLRQYGHAELRQILTAIPRSALRPSAAKLARLMFNIERFPHASRRAHT